MEGIVFDIQRNSVNDGPGIRTTIFLKGCSLNCQWCHNEESIDIRPMLRFYTDRCQDCMECVKVCKVSAHIDRNISIPEGKTSVERGDPSSTGDERQTSESQTPGKEALRKHQVLFERCIQNWDCIQVCPSAALARTGEVYDVNSLLDMVVRDRAYYENSGGGMTLSGGEPMVQYEFTRTLLTGAKERGIHTCLDTTGHASWSKYEALLEVTDLFLFDYKATGAELHQDLTGADNKLILENLRRLDKAGAEIILRCPLIPGLNDQEEHLEAIAALSKSLSHIREVHLLPYHTMGTCKGAQHGVERLMEKFRVPTQAEKDGWMEKLEASEAGKIVIF